MDRGRVSLWLGAVVWLGLRWRELRRWRWSLIRSMNIGPSRRRQRRRLRLRPILILGIKLHRQRRRSRHRNPSHTTAPSHSDTCPRSNTRGPRYTRSRRGRSRSHHIFLLFHKLSIVTHAPNPPPEGVSLLQEAHPHARHSLGFFHRNLLRLRLGSYRRHRLPPHQFSRRHRPPRLPPERRHSLAPRNVP